MILGMSCGTKINSADPDQTSHYEAPGQDLRCLLTMFYHKFI